MFCSKHPTSFEEKKGLLYYKKIKVGGMAIWQIFQKDAIYIICQSLIQGHHPWNKISNTLFNLTVFWHSISMTHDPAGCGTSSNY